MGLYDAMNNSPKEKKEKTLLKDKEASEIGLIKGLVVDNFGEAREKGSQYRDAKGELQDGFLGYKVNKKTGEEEVEPKATPIVGESAEKWRAKMVDARKRWDDLAARIGSNNTLYGAKVAEDDRRLPESVAYLDGTMPRKVAKSTTEQAQAAVVPTEQPTANAQKPKETESEARETDLEKAGVVRERYPVTKDEDKIDDIRRMAKERGIPDEYWRTTTQTLAGENVGLRPEAQESAPVTPAKETSTPAAQATAEQPVTETKSESTEQTPAPKEQPVENGEYIELNGKRYKKVNFDEIPDNHAAARKAGYPIFRSPGGGIIGALEGNEVDNIGKYYAQINGEWYEVVDNPIAKDAGRTFGIPQPTATTAAQSTATTTQQEAAKDEVPAQPASTAQQTTKAPAATENDPWKYTKNWWQPSTYVQDEEAYQKLVLEQQRREERNEKRRRNRALIADLVNMGVALGSTAGGAVAVPEVPILSKKSNDKLRELREKQAALQLEFAKNRRKARQLDAQDFAKRVKAEVDAEKEAKKDAETKEYRDKRLKLEEERIAIAKQNAGNKGKNSGSGNSKDTWTVEGKTYTDVVDAWVALPEDAMTWVIEEEGIVKAPSTTQMKADLAMYKKNKETKKTTNKQQTNSNKKTNKQQTNSKKTTTSNSSPQQAKEGNREPKKKEDKVGSSAMADLVKKAEEIMNNTPPSRR